MRLYLEKDIIRQVQSHSFSFQLNPLISGLIGYPGYWKGHNAVNAGLWAQNKKPSYYKWGTQLITI